jgi:hypothetical protein
MQRATDTAIEEAFTDGAILRTHEVIDGRTWWFAASMPTDLEPSREAYLLPAFDEFLVGFTSFDQSRKAGQPDGKNLLFNSTILYGSQVIGSWKRSFAKGAVAIELSPFSPLPPRRRQLSMPPGATVPSWARVWRCYKTSRLRAS